MNKTLILFFFVLIFAKISMAESSATLFLKYSSNDCIVCNLPLITMVNRAKDLDKVVVFRTENKDRQFLADVIEMLEENSIRYIFSDSVYFKYDNYDVSVAYLQKDNKLIKVAHLKDFPIDSLRYLLQASSPKQFPPQADVSQSEDYINIFERRHSTIARISKRNLCEFADTIFLNKKNLLLEAFKANFPVDYKERYDTVAKNAKRFLGAINPIFSSPVYSNDTIFSIVSFKSRTRLKDSLGEANYIWVPYASFMTYVPEKNYIKMVPIKLEASKLNGEDYYSSGTGFFFFKNELFLGVTKTQISNTNKLYAKATINSDGYLEIASLSDVSLPEFNVKSDMGYMLLNKTSVK